jgi:peptidoglycan/xylan/chitin deacetylase (PgdA/CDA1 family)
MSFACLMYHSLSDGRFPDREYAKYTTTREMFAEHLRLLMHKGFRLASFGDLLRRLQSGRPISSEFCVLTFDDGHKSSLDLAEVMVQAGVRGTFFVTMNYCRERNDFLKPEEIRQLTKENFDFGTHGVTHRALSRMPHDQMRAELRDSKAWLEDIIGKSVRSMSLPAGQGSTAVFETAYELGYQLVGTSIEKTNHPEKLPAQINRFVVLAQHCGPDVCKIASGSALYQAQRQLRSALLALPKRLLRSYDATRR